MFTLIAALNTYINYLGEIERVSEGFYNNFSVRFKSDSFSDTEGLSKLKDLYDNVNMKKFVLYDITDTNNGLGGFVGVLSKNYSDFPKLQAGRYFKEDDFFHGSRVAVIGSNFINRAYFNNNERYVDLLGATYKVIGIFQAYKGASINSAVYYNLDSKNPGGKIFILDARDVKSVARQISIMENSIKLQKINASSNSINRFFHYDRYTYILLVFIIMFILALSSIKVYFVLRLQKDFILVFNLLGLRIKEILYKCFLNFFCSEAISILAFLILNTMVMQTLSSGMWEYYSISQTLFYGLIMIIFTILLELTLVLHFLKRDKETTGEKINEKNVYT
ncbi:ABC transporter permease [Anaerobacterium chartisolvens]|nr:ABC transporter permease [Anaerobacterium chartisolvens]